MSVSSVLRTHRPHPDVPSSVMDINTIDPASSLNHLPNLGGRHKLLPFSSSPLALLGASHSPTHTSRQNSPHDFRSRRRTGPLCITENTSTTYQHAIPTHPPLAQKVPRSVICIVYNTLAHLSFLSSAHLLYATVNQSFVSVHSNASFCESGSGQLNSRRANFVAAW
jgi:hypothetical protein